MTTAYLFPGQGAEQPGMGQAFFNDSLIFKENILCADAVLDFDLPAYLFGDKPLLAHPDWLQPALVAYSVALYRASADQARPQWLAGLSLGEYTALIASGMVSLAAGLRLVAVRGAAMAAATATVAGGMLVAKTADAEVLAAVTALPEVWLANRNSVQQTVFGGTSGGVAAAARVLKERGVRTIRLPVAGAFHTPLMAPAQAALAEALATTTFQAGQVPVLSTTTLHPFAVDTVREVLLAQLTHPTNLVGAVTQLADAGVDVIVEASPRPVVSRLVTATVPAMRTQLAVPAEMVVSTDE